MPWISDYWKVYNRHLSLLLATDTGLFSKGIKSQLNVKGAKLFSNSTKTCPANHVVQSNVHFTYSMESLEHVQFTHCVINAMYAERYMLTFHGKTWYDFPSNSTVICKERMPLIILMQLQIIPPTRNCSNFEMILMLHKKAKRFKVCIIEFI